MTDPNIAIQLHHIANALGQIASALFGLAWVAVCAMFIFTPNVNVTVKERKQ